MTRLSAQALLDRALECSRAGRSDEALAHYAQLIQRFPGDGVAYYNRGCLYERLGRLDLAVADFREAYRLDPDEEDYRHNLAAGHFNRGLRYHKQGKDDLALADFREAHRLDPDEPDYRQALATASYNEGIDYAKGGDDARALIAFEEALRINPGNADYRHNVAATRHSLGVRYFKKQDYEHAKAEFQEALRLCPKNKVYRQCLAATEHNLRLGARTRDDEADAVPLGREQRSALDDEDTNPRIKRHLAAVPVTSSWPGQPAGYSNPDEKPIFSGDGDCPKCRSRLWIDWKLSYDTMACPACRFEFDGEAAIFIVTSYEPGKNSGNFERVREAIRMKKEAMIQQMRDEQPPHLPAPAMPMRGGSSRQPIIEAMTDSGSGPQPSPPVPQSPQQPQVSADSETYPPEVQWRLRRMRELADSIRGMRAHAKMAVAFGDQLVVQSKLIQMMQAEQELYRLRADLEQMGYVFTES